MEQITVDLLAENFSLNPYYLLHLYKELVGLSLHQYILNMKVKMFRERAISGKDILDTAFSCGFYDQSHLIRNFKKFIGITPKKYLKSINVIGA
jgi:AraC-like DNA-binding protein